MLQRECRGNWTEGVELKTYNKIKLQITFKYISFNVTELQYLGALSAMESRREKINECEATIKDETHLPMHQEDGLQT